jgi:hypothetical protein
MEKKTIQVDSDVWEKLMKLKIEMRARSVNEVLRQLLGEAEAAPSKAHGAQLPRQPQPATPEDTGLPSFAADNPWLEVLRVRGQQAKA